jgi:hypothetical protein
MSIRRFLDHSSSGLNVLILNFDVHFLVVVNGILAFTDED